MKTKTANTPNQLTSLITAAKQVKENAHAPYSNFQVGAAIESNSHRVYVGCNVENVAYPLGQCAEATAIGNMIASGDRQISRIVITASGEGFCYPCGGCRQKIAEFATSETLVIMVNHNGETQTQTMGELLPHSFTLNATDKAS